MTKTICGTKISTSGYLITTDNDQLSHIKPISYDYKGTEIFFCEQECLDEFLLSINKENWIKNHK